uniref:Uncharacterized protein n=1 Tax=Anopheles atroparvus TaxID=41427 RepID=A0A182J5F0_ANOAO
MSFEGEKWQEGHPVGPQKSVACTHTHTVPAGFSPDLRPDVTDKYKYRPDERSRSFVGGVCGGGGVVIGHGVGTVGGGGSGAAAAAAADAREAAAKIRLKTGKPRPGSVDEGCKIMIDIKSSPDYLNRSSGGSFDSSYKSSWGSHSSTQSQAVRVRPKHFHSGAMQKLLSLRIYAGILLQGSTTKWTFEVAGAVKGGEKNSILHDTGHRLEKQEQEVYEFTSAQVHPDKHWTYPYQMFGPTSSRLASSDRSNDREGTMHAVKSRLLPDVHGGSRSGLSFHPASSKVFQDSTCTLEPLATIRLESK